MLYFLPHRPDDKRQREQTRGGGACEGDERAGKLPQRKRRRGADRAGHGGERQTDGLEDQTADAEGGRAFFAVFHFHSRKHTQCLPVHILSDSIRSI